MLVRGPIELHHRPDFDVVVLDEQDPGRWDHAPIAEALPLVEEALRCAAGRDQSRCRHETGVPAAGPGAAV